MRISPTLLSLLLLSVLQPAQAEILPEALLGIKISLVSKPTTRPMTVAHIPSFRRYYIADGGLAPMGSDTEAAVSKSMVHSYSEDGQHMNSSRPGYDNRSIYYNPNTYKLETITYNVSSDVGFAPNTGIFSIDLAENGDLKDSSVEILGFNPAFGDSNTMPSYDSETNHYYAKQKRSNKVWVVDLKLREKISEIALDFATAGVAHDDVADSFIAFSSVKGQELVLLDVDHKAVLIFDLTGKYIGKSELPKNLKLRANNHYNGTGYANGMLFVLHEPEGEFGTYYGFKVLKSN
jgi:hypothetical protein